MNSFNWLFLVYFVYGLAFFSLGLVVLMEILRIPITAGPARLLRPLCVFGFLHSLHEWSEMFVIEMGHHPISITFGWVRTLLLAFSFVALWLYGLETFRYARPGSNSLTRFGFWTLPVYALAVILDVTLAFWQGRVDTFQVFNGLTRYLLAVPSAALATIGLRVAAIKAQRDQRRPLDVYLNWAAIGFAAYSLTQLFVPQMDTFLANILNAGDFAARTGLPIQALRTMIALLITFNIFQGVNFLEKERQAQLEQAQQERLKALEQQEILRRELLQHTVRTQEEERAHVARELHDEMAQILTAFSLDLGTLQQGNAKSVSALRQAQQPILKRLQDLSRQMSQGMYRMVRSLRPAHLDELGLEAALRYMLEQEFKPRGLPATLEIRGESHRVEPLVETVLFRVAQEALTNVQRHAQATETRFCLCYEKDSVCLRVSDNGQGFDPSQTFSAPHGWGLAGMKERAESMRGQLRVESASGQGTTIEVWIPCSSPKGAE
jgi:signal transduction histidine kinase